MEYKVWIFFAVVILILLSLYVHRKKSSENLQPETVATKDTKEVPSYRAYTGVNLRENFRVPLHDVHCFVEFLDVDNEEWNPRFFNGVLKNISVGGVKVVCEHEYPINDDMQIKVRFSLRDNMFIVKGRIVRKELYLEKDKFGYGVQFTDFLDEDKELLYQILTRILIERRRKTASVGLVGEESMA